MRILEVCDRVGWAINRLTFPISKMKQNVDLAYFNAGPTRYLDTGYSDWKTAQQVTEELVSEYDIVHYHRLEAAVAFEGNCKEIKAKRIISIHTARIADLIDERISRFDAVILPNKKSYNLVKHKNKSFVPYGIDLEKYEPSDIEPKDKEIGFVGRIVPWKRWGTLQKACHTIDFKAIGCGYIECGLCYNPHNLVEDMDFEYNIFMPEAQMRSFYNHMKVFVCLSMPNNEAGPLPVLEAMACGIPVISTRVGWANDYCTDGENIIFIDEDKVEKPHCLADLIKEVHNNKELRKKLVKNGLELVKEFSIERYVENVYRVYDLINNK